MSDLVKELNFIKIKIGIMGCLWITSKREMAFMFGQMDQFILEIFFLASNTDSENEKENAALTQVNGALEKQKVSGNYF